MARSTNAPSHNGDRTVVPPTVTLALWRLRRTWGLLLVTGLGIVAAVLLVCAVPLYSDTSMTAGLRGILTSSTQNSEIAVHSTSLQIDASIYNGITQQLDNVFQTHLGLYLAPSAFSIETPEYTLLKDVPGPHGSSLLQPTVHEVQLVTLPMNQAASHVKLLGGRLPQAHSNDIEIAITQESADKLKATVGSVISVQLPFVYIPITRLLRTLTYRIVGIIQPPPLSDSYWHGHTFESVERQIGLGTSQTIYTVLASTDTFVSVLTRISSDPALKGLVLELPANLLWYYRLDASRVSINDLDAIVHGITGAQVDVSNLDLDRYPYTQNTQVYLPSDILHRYHDRIPIARLPVLSLLVLVLGLVLYFVSMMTDLLVDRQSDAIAILRSRGASRLQIFGSIATQGTGLALIALIAGSLLAIPTVYFLLRQTLAPGDQGVLSLLTGTPLLVALGLRWYALATAAVAVVAMTFSIFRATRQDVLAMRRESARASRQPLWQRLNLDSVAAIIMLVGYGFSSYITTSGVLDVQLRLLLLSPLTLVGSVALLLACLLLFLRFFPLLLAAGSWLATRGRSAPAVLALAQMARSPRQAIRMTLLLALATSFAIFTLIFIASQTQRITDVTNYQGGADFSGTIAASSNGSSFSASLLQKDTALYRAIPGVTSAALGFRGKAGAGGSALALPIELRAVDADTYAHTAIWTAQDSSQSVQSLMSMLAAQRSSAAVTNAVPAIIDASAWDVLHLSPDAPFTLSFSDGLVNFIVVAEVQHIPSVTDSAVSSGSNDLIPAGGVLVDYTTFANVYASDFKSSGNTIPMNYAWLRTRSDPASLASVRHAISQGELQLTELYDRRATFDALHREPLYLDLIGVLALGATTALLLALVGNLLASWLSARGRLTTFAVLRALGTTPRELASVLTWEQALIYTTSIVLGVLFGAILSALIVPALVFSSVAPSGTSSDPSSGTFFVSQSVPPIQIIIPSSLGLALAVLIAICLLALGMMIRVVSQPSISQTLRLNED